MEKFQTFKRLPFCDRWKWTRIPNYRPPAKPLSWTKCASRIRPVRMGISRRPSPCTERPSDLIRATTSSSPTDPPPSSSWDSSPGPFRTPPEPSNSTPNGPKSVHIPLVAIPDSSGLLLASSATCCSVKNKLIKTYHFQLFKGYYRQGVALQCLGRHADALAAFSSGLAQDPKSLQLLAGLVEAAMKSPLRATLEPTYRQLQAMRLDKSPFVVISVIGQELLASAHYKAAVVVLEAALRIGTCSLKLRGSVFSALSSAYWALSMLDQV